MRRDVRESARLGAIVGLLSSLLLVLLQTASAWSARMIWAIEQPWLNLLLYPFLGIVGGSLWGALLPAWRRLLPRRLNSWALVAATLGLAPLLAVNLQAMAAYPNRVVWVSTSAVALVLAVALAYRWLDARFSGPRSIVAPTVALVLPATLWAVVVQSVLLVDSKPVHDLLPELPWIFVLERTIVPALLILVATTTALWLAARLVSTGAGRALGILVLVGAIAAYVWVQRPPAHEVASSPAGASNMNVLLIVLDTMRQDAVSAYGVVDGTTPVLDALASEGARWSDAISPGNWTLPGHASLFTGALVSRHGCGLRRPALRPRPAGEASPELPTLAEVLQRNGWYTAAYVANGQLAPSRGFDRGFAEYQEIWRVRRGKFDVLGERIWPLLGIAAADRGGDRIARALGPWFRRAATRQQPWFLFVNFLEPHAPHDPPNPWLNMFTEREVSRRAAAKISALSWRYKYGGADEEAVRSLWPLYLAAVAYQDALVGRVLDELEASGLADNTIVWITSDHGENFGWEGHTSHGVRLNDHLIQVPLLARGPGIDPGIVSGEPASLIDVVPTTLELLSLPQLPADVGRPGWVLATQSARLPVEPPDRIRIAEKLPDYLESPEEFVLEHPEVDVKWSHRRTALLQGAWKLERVDGSADRLSRASAVPRPPSADGRVDIYDPERLDELSEALRVHLLDWQEILAPLPGDHPVMDADRRRQLEALGYLDQ